MEKSDITAQIYLKNLDYSNFFVIDGIECDNFGYLILTNCFMFVGKIHLSQIKEIVWNIIKRKEFSKDRRIQQKLESLFYSMKNEGDTE